MSILLDALKKSEAQRRLGETPNLNTPVESAEVEPAQIRPWLIGAMLLSVGVVLALYITEQFDEPDLSILGYSEFGEAVPEQVAAADARSVDAEASGGGRTPVERLSPGFTTRKAQSVPDNGQKSQLRRSVSTYQPPATQAPQAQPTTPREKQAGAADQPRNRQLLARKEQPAANQAEEPPPPPTLTFWQLPQGLRDNMPDLKISVLVYAAEPADRFILMDGQRLREGDDAGGGLDLKEIRRDGAVFTYRKYTFLLPN
jgi:general secretion pathway protein B